MKRRDLLRLAALAPAAGLLAGLSGQGSAASDDFRVLVVVYLNGGNDGNNVLVPLDGMYGDYQSARQNLAIPKASLHPLPGTAAGHSFGIHPAMQPLLDMYGQQRLAFISNVGPLIRPATARQVLDGAVEVPPFLLSHSDQQAIVQGWTVSEDMSGWAGRSLELLPGELHNRAAAVTLSTDRTLVLGRSSPVTFLNPGGSQYWGIGDLSNPAGTGTQALVRMARWQFANEYEAEFARTYGLAIDDSIFFTQAFANAITPAGNFVDNEHLNHSLRGIASVLPYFKSVGLRRQVILLNWGGFDTHANQRGSGENTQDAQLDVLAKALRAFDDSNRASGMDANVVTLVMTEFGRTVRPGSGGGSEHAWGNHWWAFGGPVAGGTVVGAFPSPVLGGSDDGDPGRNGRFVPTTSTDQVGASLMQWMGLPPSQFHGAFPHLANFSQKTIPLIRA